mgnify:CR=1 FL=1|jgi:hypothetical protein
MGRDEHKRRSNKHMAQTPKKQLTDGIDVEFAEELADHNDKEAQARSQAADRRAKKRK